MGFMDKMKDLVGITDEYDDDYDNISQEEIDAYKKELRGSSAAASAAAAAPEPPLQQQQPLRNRRSVQGSARSHSARWHRRRSSPRTRNLLTRFRAMTPARSKW